MSMCLEKKKAQFSCTILIANYKLLKGKLQVWLTFLNAEENMMDERQK